MTHVEREIIERNRASHRLQPETIAHMMELRSQGHGYMEIRDHMRNEHSVEVTLSTIQYHTDSKYREERKIRNRANYRKRKEK